MADVFDFSFFALIKSNTERPISTVSPIISVIFSGTISVSPAIK